MNSLTAQSTCFNRILLAFVFPWVATLASSGALADPPASSPGTVASADVRNDDLNVRIEPNGITSLKHTNDTYDMEYVAPGGVVGDLLITLRTAGGSWQTIHTRDLDHVLFDTSADASHRAWESRCKAGDVEVVERYAAPVASGGALAWSIALANKGGAAIEIGDLAIAAPFNTRFGGDANANNAETDALAAHRAALTQRAIPHLWVGGSGSFLFLQRPNAVGPFLVLMPTGDTRWEMFDVDGERDAAPAARPSTGPTTATHRHRGDWLIYIHSAAVGERLDRETRAWEQRMGDAAHAPATRLGHTSVTLAPGGEARTYSLTFRFTPASASTPYEGVRDVLYDEGNYDIHVAPGMTVPTDLTTTIAIRSKRTIDSLAPEFPDQTTISEVPAANAAAGQRLFRIRFARLGENILNIHSGGQTSSLEFFVTEPLETVIKKRAAFLVARCQWRDVGKWYNGVFTEWDAVHRRLRSPDDRDGLFKYILTCDDPGLGHAPFLASKNAFMPDQGEIAALDYYIHHFVWGGLQMTDRERYPYAIYGIDNWFDNRNSKKPGPEGREHVWRIFDYPHVVLLYYRMFQIASFYPAIKTELSANDYLTRAYGTAMAYFTVPTTVVDWSAYYTGTYNEVIIPDLIDALNAAGRHDDAERLRAHWEQKVKTFVYSEDPYLYGSEYAFDSTTFEGSAALAKWAVERMAVPGYTPPPALPAEHVNGQPPRQPNNYPAVTPESARAFMQSQLTQNVSDRGWLENCYYYQGSDYRGGFGSGYVLSYMSQMGGWGVLDYALHDAADPVPLVRLGYASILSSWALVNSGTPASNYGYWFPGKENDGSAGGGFEPRPFSPQWIGKIVPRGSWYYANEIDLGFAGALRSAATVVVDDPIFGPIAYGGELSQAADAYFVIPRDGVRQRLHVLLAGHPLHLDLSHDAFAADQPIVVARNGQSMRFTLENRTGRAHHTVLRLSDAKAHVRVNNVAATSSPAPANSIDVDLPLSDGDTTTVSVDLP